VKNQGASKGSAADSNEQEVATATLADFWGSKWTPGLREGGDGAPVVTYIRRRLVEVDRAEQIEAVLAAGADTILLDNFTTAQLSSAVAQITGRALVEASGGITLARIREVTETGVDIISVGALTHSV
jgi:nicotinate-nucleotide pyrophosphorylase (carboxylating)